MRIRSSQNAGYLQGRFFIRFLLKKAAFPDNYPVGKIILRDEPHVVEQIRPGNGIRIERDGDFEIVMITPQRIEHRRRQREGNRGEYVDRLRRQFHGADP
jgi:hypothetical protein